MPAEPARVVLVDESFEQLPRTLAKLHGSMAVGTAVRFQLPAIGPPAPSASQLVVGAGFDPVGVDPSEMTRGGVAVDAIRANTLADTVAPGMRVLVCGLNPSVHAAIAGVGYAGPGNRFWPAMVEVGLATRLLDPMAMLDDHGVGMTDLVKRATPRAAALTTADYIDGLDRIERLVAWLEPRIVAMVGLAGWRLAVDRSARPGLQEHRLGGRPVYLMPSTSGLNTHSTMTDLVEHLNEIKRLSPHTRR